MLASSTDTASSNAAAIAGPLIFAIIAVNFGLTAVFFVAGSIALASSVLPLIINAKGTADDNDSEDKEKPSQIQQTKDGFKFVSNHPILPGLFLLDVGITTASFYREILPVLALGLFAGGASATPTEEQDDGDAVESYSTMTPKQGVQNLLCHYLPEVKEVVAI